ncbi:MAG TPA: hypothetical protein P5040_05195 [Smithella sp.]|nr:hypothetical protein [Smithella sp.]
MGFLSGISEKITTMRQKSKDKKEVTVLPTHLYVFHQSGYAFRQQ